MFIKNLKIIGLNIVFLILTGCTNTISNDSNSKQNFQDICNEYRDYIINQITKEDYCGQGTKGILDYECYETTLLDIFYSPVLNTCITHYSKSSDQQGINLHSGEYEKKEIVKTLFDIFSDKKIGSYVTESNESRSEIIINEEKSYQEKLDELTNSELKSNYDDFIAKHKEKQLELKEEKEKQLIEQEKLFQKNQECAKWLPEIKKREREYEKISPDSQANVQEVFYSPKTNSCLYVTHVKYITTPWTLKTLMDISYEIGTNPVNDISCRDRDPYNSIYEEMKNLAKKEGELSLKRFYDAERRDKRDCARFEKDIKEYKSNIN